MRSSTSLTGLTTREAISDALYRAVLGIDTNDLSLFKSAVVDLQEFSFQMNGGAEMKGEDAIMGGMFNFVGPMATTHSISNIRIEVKDDVATTASMTANAVARHQRQGTGEDPTAPHLTAGGIYTVDLVKDSSDGLWKMKKWVLNTIWRDGDASVMARDA